MTNALVTGASRGVGRAIAVALATRGDRVAVHYGHDRAAAERTLAALPGEGHVVVGGDLADPGAAERVVAEATGALGVIDLLVNNAAVAPGPGNRHAVTEVDYATWQRAWRETVEVDLFAAANLSYLVARGLVDAGRGGTIVNVGSRGAQRGEPDFPAYGAAKAGLHALGQSLAVALAGHGIAVATVAPGFVATERQEQRLSGPDGDAIRAQSPFGRVARPDEVAAAVVYLSSPGAVWASGAVLDLNGASHLR